MSANSRPEVLSVPGSDAEKASVLIYGMPVKAIDDQVYAGQFGNATRAVGLAFNFALNGRRTGLVVENGFQTSFASRPLPSIEFVEVDQLAERAQSYQVLLIACTNLEAFHKTFGRNPYIKHPCKVYVTCFDNGQKIDLRALLEDARVITFNNKGQRDIWRRRLTRVPCEVVPYGVNDLDYVDDAIIPDVPTRAIWIGEFRRKDMLARLFRFARANPECVVDVITRRIFDAEIPDGEPGCYKLPVANFVGETPAEMFYQITADFVGEDCPSNVRYLGVLEGENHVVLGNHTIGLDFSRFPSQRHDNTKIMDYLRSGLCVICDRGTPSHRFVDETKHGVVVSPDFSEEEIRRAFQRCLRMSTPTARIKTARLMKEKYGWSANARTIAGIIDRYCSGRPRDVQGCSWVEWCEIFRRNIRDILRFSAPK